MTNGILEGGDGGGFNSKRTRESLLRYKLLLCQLISKRWGSVLTIMYQVFFKRFTFRLHCFVLTLHVVMLKVIKLKTNLKIKC